MLTKVEKINRQDIANFDALGMIISQGNFDIKGEAVSRVAHLFTWYESLKPKLISIVAEQENAAKIATGKLTKKKPSKKKETK